jgi:3-hydroxyacyl-CoA dehydrogenase
MMASSEKLVPEKAMSSLEASAHVDALVRENHRGNYSRFGVEQSRPINRIGVVGAGVMGSFVAASAIRHGVSVAITDQNPDALASVGQAIKAWLAFEGGEPRSEAGQPSTELVTMTSSLEEVADCDLVVESIVENVTTKRNFYIGLERLCADDTVIVSNTSTLPIAELAAHLRTPQRFCGLHYFPPIGERKMVEIIPGAKTTDDITSRLIKFSERIGRLPVVVADGRGFVVNRILMAYMSAGIRLLMQGVNVNDIETAALGFGMKMGPIRLYDEVGLDVALHCGFSLSTDSDTLVVRSPPVVRLIKAKQLGRKTGRGFFIHQAANQDEKVGDVNPLALQLFESEIESRVDLSPAEIQSAVVLPMVIEATKLLEINRASSAGQLDLAVMCGIGFAPLRGGPLYWADQVGANYITEAIKSLEYLGPHLSPTQTLLDAAKYGQRFYDRKSDGVGPTAASSTAVRNMS